MVKGIKESKLMKGMGGMCGDGGNREKILPESDKPNPVQVSNVKSKINLFESMSDKSKSFSA